MDARGNGSAGCRERAEQAQEVKTEDEEFPMIPKTLVSATCLGLFALIAFASSATPDHSRIAAWRGAAPVVEAVQPSDGVVVGSGVRSGMVRSGVRSGGEQFSAFAPACSDSTANCSDPVKHLGTQNDCACFACGYGTPKQRSVCTRNPADKDALFKRAK
jgi:hypothetical protein